MKFVSFGEFARRMLDTIDQLAEDQDIEKQEAAGQIVEWAFSEIEAGRPYTPVSLETLGGKKPDEP